MVVEEDSGLWVWSIGRRMLVSGVQEACGMLGWDMRLVSWDIGSVQARQSVLGIGELERCKKVRLANEEGGEEWEDQVLARVRPLLKGVYP